MKKKWILNPKANEQLVTELQESLGVAKIVSELLVQRGITTFEAAKKFFRSDLSHLHDPFLMKDMNCAVARLSRAIQHSENILVYGDYDVDGTTAVSLMYSFIKSIHDKVEYYIPDRYVEGNCPTCNAEGARGDQCDTCSATYEATELINPKSKMNPEANIEIRPTEHYFTD